MGFDYWLVHLTWTVPPALLTTALYWPFFSKLEMAKVSALVSMAVVCTLPWDSFLVRNRIWSYPTDAVVGISFFSVPIEEIFFFVIQTYNTGILYVILTKQLVLPVYLGNRTSARRRLAGFLGLGSVFLLALLGVVSRGRHTYMSLILAWVTPFLMLQWAVCSHFLLALPRARLLLTVLLPSLYLCIVDALALRRGTWVIEDGTKMGYEVLGLLEIEEAVFFFVTNLMIVMGLVTVDYHIAMEEYQMARSPSPGKRFPSLTRLLRGCKEPDADFIRGLADAVDVVSSKSQTMYMGSAMFEAALRIDLILLYNFCRVLDDVVDEADDLEAARSAVQTCRQALRVRFQQSTEKTTDDYHFVCASPALSSAIALLPVSRLSIEPLDSLLLGFETDFDFSQAASGYGDDWPIATERDLETYAYRVAGTVAASLLSLVLYHYPLDDDDGQQRQGTTGDDNDDDARRGIVTAGARMGQALQYVNIARDVGRDAAIGRVYLPQTWLRQEGLDAASVVARPRDGPMAKLQGRMLDKAHRAYRATEAVMDELPVEVRGPIRTVVEGYMAIAGSVLADGLRGKGKLKLPWWRRLIVARRAMGRAKGV
ncbi:phytoene synthase [Ophiocordyceps camponoti-floridani]|uniref:Bifunctional lycopene cyclase/phytoene synthase n=1 Tax=Ophiocordyceps camponoti-floridani TaxID=2030778 RepID=A0A8H4QB72_9HYPO|nr:phytoene synthase [Ophiocordyceps camponoti-floridani]